MNIPKYVSEAKAFDDYKINKIWWDAICKEAKNVHPEFEIWEGDNSDLSPAYQNITCHMICDVNMVEKFRRIPQFVADGHKT